MTQDSRVSTSDRSHTQNNQSNLYLTATPFDTNNLVNNVEIMEMYDASYDKSIKIIDQRQQYKKAENEAQLLNNRIRHLSQEEQKVFKKIEDAQKKAIEIISFRERNIQTSQERERRKEQYQNRLNQKHQEVQEVKDVSKIAKQLIQESMYHRIQTEAQQLKQSKIKYKEYINKVCEQIYKQNLAKTMSIKQQEKEHEFRKEKIQNFMMESKAIIWDKQNLIFCRYKYITLLNLLKYIKYQIKIYSFIFLKFYFKYFNILYLQDLREKRAKGNYSRKLHFEMQKKAMKQMEVQQLEQSEMKMVQSLQNTKQFQTKAMKDFEDIIIQVRTTYPNQKLNLDKDILEYYCPNNTERCTAKGIRQNHYHSLNNSVLLERLHTANSNDKRERGKSQNSKIDLSINAISYNPTGESQTPNSSRKIIDTQRMNTSRRNSRQNQQTNNEETLYNIITQ